MDDLLKDPTKEKLVAGGFFTQNIDASYERVVKMLASETSRVGWTPSLENIFIWQNDRCITAYENLKQPLALINSDFEPTLTEGIRRVVPDVTIDFVAGSGHCVMWDFPDTFEALIEKNVKQFLNSD
jgi:pimeloyl-ACP methyl ester carboxylesterase